MHAEENKSLENHSISDLMKMREDVEEIYGKGTFYSSIGKEIIEVLGLKDPRTEDKANDGQVTVEGENIPIAVSIVKSANNFKEALIGVEGKDKKKEEVCNRIMKPLAVPRYEGGNLVIDLDEEDYNRGVDELKYSVVGSYIFQKTVSSLLQWRSKIS